VLRFDALCCDALCRVASCCVKSWVLYNIPCLYVQLDGTNNGISKSDRFFVIKLMGLIWWNTHIWDRAYVRKFMRCIMRWFYEFRRCSIRWIDDFSLFYKFWR
jgi:hypothetical protein